ncbi:MAG: polyamine ABC transporter substrate-binding protein [Limisphaerales bacterium]
MKLDCRIRAFGQTVLLVLLALTLPGCGKINNPHPDAREKRGLIFFNYFVENRMETANAGTKASDNRQIYEGLTLRVLVWTNYLPTAVLKGFTDRFGAQVAVSYYDTNDELYDRLARGEPFDVVMPAGFMLQRLIERGMVRELNHKSLANLRYLDPEYHTNLFDPGNAHAIPYLWSTAGIAYNFNHLDHIPHKWADLLDPDPAHATGLSNRVSLLPGPVRAIAAALVHLGHSPNSNDTKDLDAAAEVLQTQMEKVHFRFLGGALADALVSEDILMAQAYSSEAERARRRNPHINFTLPEDGVWLTVDHLAIPATTDAQHKVLAEAFINYLLDPVIAAKVVNYSRHASTLSEARAFVEPEVKLGPPYLRPDHIVLQMYDRQGDAYRQLLWDRMTNRFKIQSTF